MVLLGTVVLLGVNSAPAAAAGIWEGISGWWQRVCAPNPRLDPEYVFQPRKGWGAATGYELISNSMNLTPKVEYTGEGSPSSKTMDIQVGPRQANLVMVQATYGPLTLGLSQEVGAAFSKNKYFGFNIFSNSYSLDIRYSSISDIPNCTVSTPSADPYVILVTNPAVVRSLVINGVYTFGKRFSYQAVFSGRSVQRRSGGSWLVATRYTRGQIIFDPRDSELLAFMSGYGRYATNQSSLGGGYSFNWVLFHRDAQSPKDLRRMKNLTFNATVTPMLTLFNEVTYQQYKKEPSYWELYPTYSKEIADTYRSSGRIQPNFMARAGFVYHFGHFYVNAWGDYTRFVLASRGKQFGNAGSRAYFSQTGSFDNWSITIKLNYRF